MTNKQIKEHEKYLSSQSKILNKSLDFWQVKTLEQISWLEGIGVDDDEPTSGQQEAQQELDYCMTKLQWENLQLGMLDRRIKTFLKGKNSK
jgi:hypothetical protein